MRAIHSRIDEAMATAAAIDDQLTGDEEATAFFVRTMRRRLCIGSSPGARLRIDDGRFSGVVNLRAAGRELYLNVPELEPRDIGQLLGSARALMRFGGPTPAPRPSVRHNGSDGSGASSTWINTPDRLDMQALAGTLDQVREPIQRGLQVGQSISELTVTDLFTESVFAGEYDKPCQSQCYGVEVRATLTAGDGAHRVGQARYAPGLAAMDLDGLGRELALLAVGMSTMPTRAFTGDEVVLTPGAASQLLRHLVDSILLNPIRAPIPLCTAVVDDGRAPGGHGARAHDCEGTPTGRLELVTRDGVQQPIATRLKTVAHDGASVVCRTGHARWDPSRSCPQVSANNVHLAPGGGGADPLVGERCVVVDVRSLGVEEHRSGGALAFRLLSTRARDGAPIEPLRPFAVTGSAIDLLAAVTRVWPGVSYFPGTVSVGGSYLALSISSLVSRR